MSMHSIRLVYLQGKAAALAYLHTSTAAIHVYKSLRGAVITNHNIKADSFKLSGY